MSSSRMYVCVLALAFVGISQSLPVSIEDEQCPQYAYCDGESFPNRFKVMDRSIWCAEGVTEDTLRNNCCMVQKHVVCYDIKIEGELLNYSNETTDLLSSTNFSNLCEHMLREVGKTAGSYNSADIKAGGGDVAFLYDAWRRVEPSDDHIVHLACGVRD